MIIDDQQCSLHFSQHNLKNCLGQPLSSFRLTQIDVDTTRLVVQMLIMSKDNQMQSYKIAHGLCYTIRGLFCIIIRLRNINTLIYCYKTKGMVLVELRLYYFLNCIT